MGRMKYFAAGVAFLAIVSILIPFPMIVARHCTITVLDENGAPRANVKVSRGWAYGSKETLEEAFTGSDGTVTFPARVQGHSLLARCLVPTLGVLVVHGSAHISDGYIVTFPTNYTAKIESDTDLKWVDEKDHLAQIDLQNLPRDQSCRAKFIVSSQRR